MGVGPSGNFRSEQVGTKCLSLACHLMAPRLFLELEDSNRPSRMDLMIPYLTLGLRVIHIQALSSSRARASLGAISEGKRPHRPIKHLQTS